MCKKCGFWHGEKERCRTATPDKGRTENRHFDQRPRNGPKVNEGELPLGDVEDAGVEEADVQSTGSSDKSESHF